MRPENKFMRIAFLHRLRRAVSRPSPAWTPMSFTQHQVYVHPCVINNHPHIVYPQGLQTQEPKLFQSLQDHYRRKGYALKEDQRRSNPTQQHVHERRRWAPVLLFTVDLIFDGAVFADTNNVRQETEAQADHQVELLLVPKTAHNHPVDALHVLPSQQTKPETINSAAANRIYDLLRQHYKKQDSDPDYILNDFREIANYYSSFPDVINILDSLNSKNWKLIYDEHSWVTVASGNVFQVDNVSVHFNTRSAAQLKMYNRCKENPVCIASPADALLHELLHTQSMLVKTREFLAQGGMNSVMYPYRHEYAIIDAERKLYASMSVRDAIKRPQRIDHTGRLVKAQCPTCIK